MTPYQRQMRSNLLVGAVAIGIITVAIGCRSAETRSPSTRVAVRPATDAGEVTPSRSTPRQYMPPALENDAPSSQDNATPVPPAPVPRAEKERSFSLWGNRSSGLKPVSSEISAAPRLLTPGRAKSLREFVDDRGQATIR